MPSIIEEVQLHGNIPDITMSENNNNGLREGKYYVFNYTLFKLKCPFEVCIAPDYILVPIEAQDALINALKTVYAPLPNFSTLRLSL